MSDTAQLGYLTLAGQTAKGTPNVAGLTTGGVRATGFTLGPDTEVTSPDAEIGGTRDPNLAGAAFGGFKVGGSVDGYLRYAVLLPLMLRASGFVAAAPTVVTAGQVFKHTFTPGAAQYLTAETSWGLNRAIRRFSDLLVNSFSISLSANERATLTAEFVGAIEAWQAAPTAVTYPTADGIGNFLGSAITFDTLGTYRFTEAEIAVANNLSDDEYVIGSRSLDDVTAGEREITFTGTIKLGTNTPSLTDLYRAAAYGSKTATAPAGSDPYQTSFAHTVGSTKLIGTSLTEKYRALFTVPSAVLNAIPLEASGADVLSAQIEAKAYSDGINPIMTIDVWNNVATQYA